MRGKVSSASRQRAQLIRTPAVPPERLAATSLMRGLLVLECFSPESDSFTLAELSRLLSFPKSSLHRVVKTLSRMEYLRYEEQSKRYYLGVRVLSLGFSVLQSMELREI